MHVFCNSNGLLLILHAASGYDKIVKRKGRFRDKTKKSNTTIAAYRTVDICLVDHRGKNRECDFPHALAGSDRDA